MDQQSPPPRFDELCFKIGLAIIQAQKVQFSLAYYYGVYQIKNAQWTKEQAQASIDLYLTKPMGAIITEIENKTSIDPVVLQRVKEFRNERNWLAHDFDQESSAHLRVGLKIPEYIDRMDSIVSEAVEVMQDLDHLGELLSPIPPA